MRGACEASERRWLAIGGWAVWAAAVLIAAACSRRSPPAGRAPEVEVASGELVLIARLLEAPDDASFLRGAERLQYLERPLPWSSGARDSGQRSANEALAERRIAPALVRAMRSKNPHVRAAAARSFGEVADLAGALVADLAELLDSEDSDVRESAAFGLCVAGPQVETVLDVIVDHLNDPELSVARNLVQALVIRGPAAKPHVLAGIASGRDGVRAGCLDAFGMIEWSAAEAGEVARLLRCPDSGLRSRVAATFGTAMQLGNIRLDAALVEMLSTALRDSEADVRSDVAAALSRSGRWGDNVVGDLVGLLSDPVPRVREAAALSIRELGARAVDLSPLTLALDDESYRVRRDASTALGKLGAGAGPAQEKLRALAQADPNEMVRKAAAKALEEVRADTQRAQSR